MLIVTCRRALLQIPISMTEIAVLIPPVMIPAGRPASRAARAFSCCRLSRRCWTPDPTRFVTTFLTFYTGLVPMLATAGNTIQMTGSWARS